MLMLFKNRSITVGDRVSIHLNLHRNDYAITALEGPYKGKVVAYAKCVSLQDVTFKVRENVRNRVREKGVKEVHAWVLGRLSDNLHGSEQMREAYYNPYQVDTFVDRATKNPITQSLHMIFKPKTMYYA